ncbi:type IX secretion system ring subunit PorN/GldN [Epilithonimonas mollis]|nr:gliding motility protein GldN [Epilithonimonas mollis]
MKKILYSLICLSSTMAFGQNILNANSPQTFREEREIKKDSIAPLKYGFIEDKDILRSMVVWEIIDMNDKINQPFYHNSDGLVSQNKSLYQVLLEAVNSGKIKEVYDGDDFTSRLTPEAIANKTSVPMVDNYFTESLNSNKIENAEVQRLLKYFTSMKGGDDKQVNTLFAKYQSRLQDVLVYNGNAQPTTTEETVTTGKGKKKKTKKVTTKAPAIEPGTMLVNLDGSWYKVNRSVVDSSVGTAETTTEKVKALKLMGMWYVDKRDAQLRYRLLGIAAMGEDPNSAILKAERMQQMQESGAPIDPAAMNETGDLVDLFWIYYPDARQVLSSNYIFNAKNSTSDITFDDVLNARRFSAIIYKSDNGLGRGGSGIIDEYIPNDADGQLEESDRIKAQILQMENDMWNY